MPNTAIMKATLPALPLVILMGCSQLPTAVQRPVPAMMTGPQTASQEFSYQGQRYRLEAEWKVRTTGKASVGESTAIACETSAKVFLMPPNHGTARQISPAAGGYRSFSVCYLPEVEGGVLVEGGVFKMFDGNGSGAGGASGINNYTLKAEISIQPQSNATALGEMPVHATARLSVEDATASGLPELAGMSITTSWLAKADEQGRVQLLPRGTAVR